MKATDKKKIEIVKQLAHKLETQYAYNNPKHDKMIMKHEDRVVTIPRGTLQELCRMVRRIKND